MRPSPQIELTNTKITDAIIFAANAHQEQSKKGTDIPYIFHPLNVGRILAENDCLEAVVIAGLLHDVLEDTEATAKDIQATFGEKVLKYVLAVTQEKTREAWQNRKKKYIDRAKSCSLRVLQIICADKYDNICQIADDMEKVGSAVWKRFDASMVQIHWYYYSIAEICLERFKRKEDLELACKLLSKINKVFDQNKVAYEHF
jgi:(p)ppGpp synthase/HD superfamily hydrolase